ncbi:hypothetical protein DMN91_006895 [Ooceraea biroi]|uniref:Fatty acyl-CoA reductase n=1 Tax=Ooceraea biroi TaxID=2015173 RepID=A0A3L8DKC4_OOCBI|nr:fatty acyl-CoA reductase 1-like [Ooceraea biroi]RLU20288.1 hypothetical protein DMN91_006895 [Ooceraea biroi]
MKEDTTNMFIPDFYVGRNIFITGANGYLGKALIEKLLRSCPKVGKIYMLMRPKKGLDVNERLKKIVENKLFDTLRNEQPSCFDKLIPIVGDIHAENLGLRPIDRQILIEKVTIIVNIAANVRFDITLKNAILSNTRSARDICILAQNMKNLAALVHISSTFTQTDKPVVNEELYPYGVDWKKMIKVAESVDDDILTTFTAKCVGSFPNTYVFSKRLAEEVINDYSKSLPCVMIRPSIVLPTMDEPVKGWIDNFNGPMTLYMAGGKGIVQVTYCNSDNDCQYVPVDVFVKAVIIVTCIRGTKSVIEDDTFHIYNCSDLTHVSIKKFADISARLLEQIPFEKMIWMPSNSTTSNYLKYYILIILLHIMPALFIDGILKLLNINPMLLKLQRKIYMATTVLAFFVLKKWQFRNEKLMKVFNSLSEDNWKIFGFDKTSFLTHDYAKNAILGTKQFLLNEDIMNLVAVKRHYNRMKWLDRIVRTLFVLIVLWILYRKNTLFYIIGAFFPLSV